MTSCLWVSWYDAPVQSRYSTTCMQASEAVIQWVLVQYGGQAFNCVPLNAEQWGVCIGLGALGLLVREGLRRVPVEST